MNIGICDDEENICLQMKQFVLKRAMPDEMYLFEGADELRAFLTGDKQLDILFLDIDLNTKQDGMSLAGEIKKTAIENGMGGMTLPLIIFVTGYPDRMREAFSVNAFHFLLKPVDEDEFRRVFDQARKTVDVVRSESESKVLELNNNGVTFTIKTGEIHYVESFGRKLVIHASGGDAEIYGKISDILKDLGEAFYQVHRSFVVNMNHIFDYSKQEITLDGGAKIPVSKYKRDDFVRAYAAFLGRVKI